MRWFAFLLSALVTWLVSLALIGLGVAAIIAVVVKTLRVLGVIP